MHVVAITNLFIIPEKIKDTPSYSLGSRPKDAKIYVTPAPGAYESCDTNQYKPKAPGFSLSTRYVVPSDVAMKPGPGAYTPEKVFCWSGLNKVFGYDFYKKNSLYQLN